MGIPKRKNNINVYPGKELTDRRIELNEEITKSDVNLPDGILHNDLDLGMLTFVKDNFNIVSDGSTIPVLEKILTIQKWGEITTNWKFMDGENNIKLPFISVIRRPDPQPGTNPALQRTIPDRDLFFYNTSGTWDGRQKGAEIYKIPQPVAIDISYDITIICTKITDINLFNKKVLQKFSSRQAYTKIKGHYIPIILENISDNSPVDNIDKRRFYIQTYRFILLGFLLDPEEFKVVPAINRMFVLNELVESKIERKRKHNNIDIITVSFIGDGINKVFNVGEPIGVLFNVAINGLTQERDKDYYHISGTSRVTFVEAPLIGDVVTITYYRGRSSTIVDYEGNVFQLHTDNYTFDGTNKDLQLTHKINSLVHLTINGLIEEENVSFTIKTNTIVTLLQNPVVGSKISIIYLY